MAAPRTEPTTPEAAPFSLLKLLTGINTSLDQMQ
jgi:hypothetical protein